MPEMKLKPCPFCGGEELNILSKEVFYEVQDESGDVAMYLQCEKCGLDFWEHSYSEHNYEARLKLIAEKWNRRAENEMPVQSASWELRYDEDYDDEIHCCSICGKPDAISRDDYSYRGGKIRDNDSSYCPNCGAKMDGGESFE